MMIFVKMKCLLMFLSYKTPLNAFCGIFYRNKLALPWIALELWSLVKLLETNNFKAIKCFGFFSLYFVKFMVTFKKPIEMLFISAFLQITVHSLTEDIMTIFYEANLNESRQLFQLFLILSLWFLFPVHNPYSITNGWISKLRITFSVICTCHSDV